MASKALRSFSVNSRRRIRPPGSSIRAYPADVPIEPRRGDLIARDSGRVGSNWVLDSAASLLESRLPAFTRIVEYHGLWLEHLRIEGATRPLQHGGALGMPTITNGPQELRVP